MFYFVIMDLILINTIFNFIWYISTIVFLIYKFTSFFSWVYNCCGYITKCFKSMNRICTKYFSFQSKSPEDLDTVIDNSRAVDAGCVSAIIIKTYHPQMTILLKEAKVIF